MHLEAFLFGISDGRCLASLAGSPAKYKGTRYDVGS